MRIFETPVFSHPFSYPLWIRFKESFSATLIQTLTVPVLSPLPNEAFSSCSSFSPPSRSVESESSFPMTGSPAARSLDVYGLGSYLF